jgi:hypothetical protein
MISKVAIKTLPQPLQTSPIFLPKLLKIFIMKPFERVKGLILWSPLGEIFEVKNVASNQSPQTAPVF